MSKKIYLASPFFNSNELPIYCQVIKALRDKDYEVYVPQEHEIENAWGYPNNVWGQKVYDEDVKALKSCDVVMVLNFGMYSDSGTAWEAGFAFGIGKECIQVLCGDDNTTYSLMMINGCNKVIHLENVGNWEEQSAWYPLNKIIQK